MDKEHKIAERFREVRRQLVLTQQELADRLSISRNYVAKIETGKKDPSTRTLRALENLIVDREYKQAAEKWTLGESEHANTESLEAELRSLFDQTISAARGSERRLIWLLEQMRAHLRPPAHWREDAGKEDAPPPPENPAVRAAREAGQKRGFATAGTLLEQHPQKPTGAERAV